MRNLLILLAGALFAFSAIAQESETPDSDDASVTAADPTEEQAEEAPDFDEAGLDEQGFSNEDDDFDPTEEIPTDQSIEFPADI